MAGCLDMAGGAQACSCLGFFHSVAPLGGSPGSQPSSAASWLVSWGSFFTSLSRSVLVCDEMVPPHLVRSCPGDWKLEDAPSSSPPRLPGPLVCECSGGGLAFDSVLSGGVGEVSPTPDPDGGLTRLPQAPLRLWAVGAMMEGWPELPGKLSCFSKQNPPVRVPLECDLSLSCQKEP